MRLENNVVNQPHNLACFRVGEGTNSDTHNGPSLGNGVSWQLFHVWVSQRDVVYGEPFGQQLLVHGQFGLLGVLLRLSQTFSFKQRLVDLATLSPLRRCEVRVTRGHSKAIGLPDSRKNIDNNREVQVTNHRPNHSALHCIFLTEEDLVGLGDVEQHRADGSDTCNILLLFVFLYFFVCFVFAVLFFFCS